jgi:hypothetical protein
MTMLRQTMLGSLAAVLLAPALLVVGTPSPAHARVVKHHEWGLISAADAKLRKGCRSYAYSYSISPPEGDWGLELFLVGPGKEGLGSAAHLIDHDPLSGGDRFTICRATTTYGRFMIRGKLSVQNGPEEYDEGWIKPAFFKLTRR